MVVVKTRRGREPGPDLLVDMRNSLIYLRYDRADDWEPVHLKNKQFIIENGQPLWATDFLGILQGLTTKDVEPYDGPHPGGSVRCSCGVLRDEDGDCQRCDYQRCHMCKTALKDGLCPSDPSHNPMPVPSAPKYDTDEDRARRQEIAKRAAETRKANKEGKK